MLWESARLPSDIHTKRTQTGYTNNQSSSQENFAWESIINHEQCEREVLDSKIKGSSQESGIPM